MGWRSHLMAPCSLATARGPCSRWRATAPPATLATLPPSVAAFHLALGPDGLFVTAPTLSASDVVYRVSFTGDVSVFHAGFGRPQGLAFSPDGTLHVVEALAGISGLCRVAGEGRLELLVSGPKLVGVAFDPTGNLVLCSSDTAYRFGAPLQARTF